jgi:hypothetical protein
MAESVPSNDVIAAIGLAVGGVFGVAGTFVPQESGLVSRRLFESAIWGPSCLSTARFVARMFAMSAAGAIQAISTCGQTTKNSCQG